MSILRKGFSWLCVPTFLSSLCYFSALCFLSEFDPLSSEIRYHLPWINLTLFGVLFLGTGVLASGSSGFREEKAKQCIPFCFGWVVFSFVILPAIFLLYSTYPSASGRAMFLADTWLVAFGSSLVTIIGAAVALIVISVGRKPKG